MGGFVTIIQLTLIAEFALGSSPGGLPNCGALACYWKLKRTIGRWQSTLFPLSVAGYDLRLLAVLALLELLK